MFRSHRRWVLLAALLFTAEVCIACFVHDGFVRPYLGDVLVVMLIFFAVASAVHVRPVPLATGVLLFAFAVEFTQAIGLIHHLGWADHSVARVVLGNTFQWGDLLCYVIGAIAALGVERAWR